MKQENNAGGQPGLIGRRDLIAMVGGAAVAWPLAARAQERSLPLIGFLYGGAADRATGFLIGIPRGLNEMGFVEGRNFAAEYRWADDHLDRLPVLAADLVQRRVAVIVTGGGPQPALAAKAATLTIPIVFFTGGDPVKFGLVPRYNRPGNNLTGFDFMIAELEQKRVGLLHELVPTAGVVAALCDPHSSWAAAILAEVAGAAKSLGLELVTVNASDPTVRRRFRASRACGGGRDAGHGGRALHSEPRQSRPPSGIGRQTSLARDVFFERDGRNRRTHQLQRRPGGRLPPGGHLCRPHPQG